MVFFIKEVNRGRMNQWNDVVIYDQWSYMTLLGILEKEFIALGKGVQNNRLLSGKGPKNEQF
jgi:hypothetical protein